VSDSESRILAAIEQVRADVASGGEQVRADLASAREQQRAELASALQQVRAELASAIQQVRAELASTRAGIMERLDRQQAKLEAIDGLLTMGLGHADEAHGHAAMASNTGRINSEQIATLRDLFRKLEARVRHLEDKE